MSACTASKGAQGCFFTLLLTAHGGLLLSSHPVWGTDILVHSLVFPVLKKILGIQAIPFILMWQCSHYHSSNTVYILIHHCNIMFTLSKGLTLSQQQQTIWAILKGWKMWCLEFWILPCLVKLIRVFFFYMMVSYSEYEDCTSHIEKCILLC